jgi:hypothetical protein
MAAGNDHDDTTEGRHDPDTASADGWASRGNLAAVMGLVIVLAVTCVVALALGGDDGAEAATGGHHHGAGEVSANDVLAAEHAFGGAHGAGTVGDAIGQPARHLGPQGRIGQFLATCSFSHSANNDPIVHFEHPGRSHLHDFYGAETTDAESTAIDLMRSETTCDKPADTAAYWQPALYDGDRHVIPIQTQAYYRAAPGVEPTEVEPYPFGLEMLAGNAMATTPQDSEAAGWTCGASTELSADPPDCPTVAPLHMVLTFPDCWDGEHLRSADHRSHVAYSADGECPVGYDVHVPQLTMSIKYPISGEDHDLRLSSGNVYSAHGDFFNGWDPDGLRREVEGCIHRDVGCDLANNREEEGPFFHQ